MAKTQSILACSMAAVATAGSLLTGCATPHGSENATDYPFGAGILLFDETSSKIFLNQDARPDLPRQTRFYERMPEPVSETRSEPKPGVVMVDVVFPGAAVGQDDEIYIRQTLERTSRGLRFRVYYVGEDRAIADQLRSLGDES